MTSSPNSRIDSFILLAEWASRVGAAQPQQEVFGAHGLAVIV